MSKNIFMLALLVIIFTTNIFSDTKINQYLLNVMQNSNDNELISVYITFNNNLTLQDFDYISYDTPKKERRQIVINRLINHANTTQQRVKNFINSQNSRSEFIEQLWIVNAIFLKANPSMINDLALQFNEINQINYNAQFPVELILDLPPYSPVFSPAVAPEPGVLLMNADDVWALGNKGWGVKVANSDDGFWWKHPDLVKGVWQNLGEDADNDGKTVDWASGTGSTFDAGDINGIDNDGNGKVDDLIGWDFTTNNYNITTASHGSATLGHVVGDGTGGTSTGVAPWSKCILMRNSSGEAQQIAAFQYALLMGADVVTSSLSWKWYFNPKPNYSLMRLTTDMSLAAGMIHTNSTSNDGNSTGVPLNISTAGCNPAPWRHPDQLKVGNLSGVIGVGNVNCNTDVIATSSPWGPFTWGNWALWNNGTWPYSIDPQHMDYPYSRVAPVEVPDSMGLLKPDVSAPGESSISTYVSSGSGYGTFGGTSSATPHTAGCIALMLSINPEMLPRDIDRVLELTAIEKGDPGKDYRYGAGRIDALLATTSPACLTEGVNGGNNWLIGQTTPANDTARELVGLKLRNTTSPWVGSVRTLVFARSGTAGTNDVEKYRLFWDVNKDNVVNTGDILLSETPYSADNQIVMDSIKFKVTDTVRHILLTAKTKSTANSSNTVVLGMPNNTYFKSYYTTNAQTANFPYGTTLTGTGNISVPVIFSLSQNYPNPFNPTTIITYSLAKQSFVKVRVFDVLGREVATLLNNTRDAGTHNIEFDANFYKGLSSGIYLYKLEASSPEDNSVYFTAIKKMILVK